MSTKATNISTRSSYTSLTLGVMQSTVGIIISLAAMLAFKLFPSLSPRAPEFHRIATPTYSQRRSRRSSVDSVATETSDITIDSVSTLVEPEIKRKHRLSAVSIREPFIKVAKTTKKQIRPLARRMSDGLTAVSSPFSTSTTSLFSPASDSYFPRVTSTHVKAAVKKARRNSADMIPFARKTAAPFITDCPGYDVTGPSPLVRKSCSLVPEECAFPDEEAVAPLVKESPLKKRKAFRPVKMGRKISRACVQVFS
ncbi:hypothetical protein BDZ89DRAFT_1146002 [Hymenopellis radicata]|nr:hypothetical protein BDZ89DRAFT_1146002 [Hymenopellis radicata]